MIKHKNGKRIMKTAYSRRCLALMLCLGMLLPMFGGLIASSAAAPETEDVKTRLLRQITHEGWDPYSESMSIEEFYALMELFEDGTLPLEAESAEAAPAEKQNASFISAFSPYALLTDDEPGTDESGTDEPGTDEPEPDAEEVYIPRTMFMFSGLNHAGETDGNDNSIASQPGEDITGKHFGPPLEYNSNILYNEDTREEPEDYPAGLDPYGMNYMRPPAGWDGVKVNEESRAVVIVPGQNVNNPSIAGDVDQSLFLKYDNRYVRRITAQNTEATILGAIKLSGQQEYVYYYLTDDKQSSDVSTTTLPAGHKFIVEYLPIEHEITYKVKMDTLDGTDVTNQRESVNVLGNDIRDTWENIIFGTEHPGKTDGGSYAFTGYAPYGYTVEFYLQTEHGAPVLQLGKDNPGAYTGVNGGWALGKEPDYLNGTKNEAHISPSPNGTKKLVVSGAFYNDEVDSNRTVIAVVTKNADPTFLVAPLKLDTNNVSGRGTSAKTTVKAKIKGTNKEVEIPYDYEDLYNWAKNQDSKYDYYENDSSLGNAKKENIAAGNVATSDNWNWNNGSDYRNGAVKMTKEADGTWSYQWTWQTNNGDNQILDTLEINGVGIMIPYFAKHAAEENNNTYNQEYPGTDGGFKTWYTETDIDHGIHIKVEYLMVFAGKPQRVYRITVTGARSNVNITGMNLMQYGSGADEFATYKLDGVTGATLKGDSVGDGTHAAAIQYFNDKSEWSDNTPQGTVVVKSDNNGINFNGDQNLHGANIRFKLADGYDSPYYLWESTKGGVIEGQASIVRDEETGEIDYSTMNQVQPLPASGQLESSYIYGPDKYGWYYIRVTTQGPQQDHHKIALLTIVARQVRYVVRYIPSYESVKHEQNGALQRGSSFVGVVANPENMPEFDHTNDSSHDSFFDPDNGIPGEQYDNKEGAYYDTAVDDVVILPTAVPTDPNISTSDATQKYRFADWVLVDDKFNPVWAWTNRSGAAVQVTTDKFGNRILITPNTEDGAIHHPALWDDKSNSLIVGNDYQLQWNSAAASYELADDSGTVHDVENWVTLTRDGKLAYASNGTPVDVPAEIDLTTLLSSWGVRDANGDAAAISASSEFHYRSNRITLEDVNQYAIANEGLGGDQTDVYVLRLMPVWGPIENPFNYKVALNWVDAQGNLYEEFFDELWSPVVTDWEIDGNNYLTVQVIKDAEPFRNWIAQHPTYAYWDDVNNNNALYRNMTAERKDGEDEKTHEENSHKAMREEMANAIAEYLPALDSTKDDPEKNAQYNKVLDALCRRDISGEGSVNNGGNKKEDFWRLGNYAYQVFEDHGTIVVWMYETKGGLVFRKEVDKEPFVYDDEFYFTVTDVTVGQDGFDRLPLNDTYRAYPEKVYDEDGNPRTTLDKDTWLVKFEDGEIVNIVKNDGSDWPSPAVTHFTLKDGEGIGLYVPGGRYTIVELGSKSGGTYKSGVTYAAADNTLADPSDWSLPNGDDSWLKGRYKKYIPPTIDNEDYDPDNPDDPANPPTIPNPDYRPDEFSQVAASVKFQTGELNVVQTLTFSNQTSSLAIEKRILGAVDYEKEFLFNVQLSLPDGVKPLYDVDNEYYYFNFNLYDVIYEDDEARGINSAGKLNGTTTNAKTGRLVMNEVNSQNPDNESTLWVADGLLFQPEPDDDGNYDWSEVDPSTAKKIRLKHNQRLYIVVTVPAQGEINYSIEEEPHDAEPYRVMGGINPVFGQLEPAKLAYALFVNIQDNVLTITNIVEGNVDPDKVFKYTLELLGEYGGYTGGLPIPSFYSIQPMAANDGDEHEVYFVGGKYEFELAAGESEFIWGLPAGIEYKVTETIDEGYKLSDIRWSSEYTDTEGVRINSPDRITADKSKLQASGNISTQDGEVQEDTIVFIHKLTLELPSTGYVGALTLYILVALVIAAAALIITIEVKRKA